MLFSARMVIFDTDNIFHRAQGVFSERLCVSGRLTVSASHEIEEFSTKIK